MKALLLAGAAILALAGPARALDVPTPYDPADPQVRRQEYRATARTRLPLTVGTSAVLTLGAGEDILRVVMGVEGIVSLPKRDQAQNAPLGNNLPLWVEKAGRTTLQVITSRGEGQPDRTYHFLVEAKGAPAEGDDPDSLTALIFTYPEDERARRAAQATQTAEARQAARERAQAARERQTAVARLQQDFRCTNGLYLGRGDASIAPDDACDDGQQMALLFRGNRPLPAVFVVEADGKERSVRPTTRGDWLIVPMLRERLVLRHGESVAEVRNDAFDPRGRDTNTGTSSPDVVREVVQARSGR